MAKDNPKSRAHDEHTAVPHLPFNDTVDTPTSDHSHWPSPHLLSNGSPPTESPSGSTLADDFDLDSLRLSQDFAASVRVQKLLTMVPVRKPSKQEFIRVHPDEHWRLQTAVLDMREDREMYLVDRALWQELMIRGEIIPTMLFAAINRQGVVFLWPIRLPGEDGRLDNWNRSALEAASIGMTSWTRVMANMALGAYEVYRAPGLADNPTWPAFDFPALLKIAFKDRFIWSLDHPVLRRFRGEL